MISPIFTTVVIVFLTIMIYMKVTTNRFNTGDAERIEKEREANSVRKKSLDDLEYIHIPFNSLPFSQSTSSDSNGGDASDEASGILAEDDPGNTPDGVSGSSLGNDAAGTDDVLKHDEEEILKLKNKKIANFTGISNTDLKLTYGAPNLTLLTEYDQNFTALVKGLDTWGAHLIEHKRYSEARKVLEFAVECRTDLKSTYTMLADMYAENFEFDKLDHLSEVAGELNSLMRGPIMRILKEKSDINKYINTK